MSTTTIELDAYARQYYLSGEVADLDIEELQQELSIDRLVAATDGARRIAELGFGTGLTTAAFRGRGLDIEVVEGSPLLVEEARSRHAGLVVHEALFEDFQPAEPYEAVLALHVLEHVEDPVALLGRLRSWLVPGGSLVVVVPNAESLHRRLAVQMGLQERLDSPSPRDVLVGHRRVYTLDTLGADLSAAGFTVADEFGHFIKTVPNSMMLDYPRELLEALNVVSRDLDPRLLANIGVRACR